MEKRTWAKLIIAVFLIVSVTLGIYFRWRSAWRGSDLSTGWGRGDLKASEMTYHRSRIDHIIANWQQTGRDADCDRDGRLKESYRTFLAIDLDKQAIWIEDDGQIQKDNYTGFPSGMKWKLHHCTPQANTELTGRTNLKIRGRYSGQQAGELFYLVGTGRGVGHISFRFNTSRRGGGYGTGPFTFKSYNFDSEGKNKDHCVSLLVNDAEYQQYLTSPTDSTPKPSDELGPGTQIQSALEDNKARWLKAEKLLHMEIERQVRRAGYDLGSLKVEPGPDFSAAHAEISGNNDSIFRGFFGGNSFTRAYLKIDYLGDDVWYAKSARDPRRPMPTRGQLDLEFLVCATGDIPDSQRSGFIEKGRKVQPAADIAPSKWKATLPNGTTVEFIGICENPSAGKQWWGPDGSPIDYAPYANIEPYGNHRSDRKIYEIAWRIKRPASSSGGGTKSSLEGCLGAYGRQIRDRYGNRMIGNLHGEGYAFDKSRETTTLKLGLKVGDQDYQYVTFNNISLVPGKNAGFEIQMQD
jgi:hypothetical protein